jgi:hypothetical protein
LGDLLGDRDSCGENGLEDARAEFITGSYDLEASVVRALFDLLAGAFDAVLGVLTNLLEGGIALGVPLLQFLFAGLEDLGPGFA